MRRSSLSSPARTLKASAFAEVNQQMVEVPFGRCAFLLGQTAAKAAVASCNCHFTVRGWFNSIIEVLR